MKSNARVGTDRANEHLAEAAFTRQSSVFDDIYADNTIVHYKRTRVRAVADGLLPPAAHILELNAGTGEDSVYFAGNGHSVHATDISTGMLYELTKKVSAANLASAVTTEQCSFTRLNDLSHKGPYDMIFSNFAGLNCTNDLPSVLGSFDELLKSGGIALLVVLPRFCLWETAMLFKGKFRTAFRRFSGKKGAPAHVEGVDFRCWYYDPSTIIRGLPSFQLLSLEGLCAIVPPSYIEHFAEKHPGVYRGLTQIEDSLKEKWPWRSIGDYYIIALRKLS